ncbi:MAG: hypothetical protein ACRD5J_08705, partial [Nitrososphaeraceae archaeon]
MIKIRKISKNDGKFRKNMSQAYMRSITLTIAAFLLTATIVLGPTSIQQQLLAQQQSDLGSVL